MATGNGVAAPSTLRDKIAQRSVARTELFESKFYDVTLEIRGMMLGAQTRMLEEGYDHTNPTHSVARFTRLFPVILAACVFDPETGEPVFSGSDDELLSRLDPKEAQTIVDVVHRLSGMSEEEDRKRKNDSADHTATTRSSSRASSASRSRGSKQT